jgi:hypothetical protein
VKLDECAYWIEVDKDRIQCTHSHQHFGYIKYLIVVSEFEYARDPESYTSSSIATGRASLAGQVKG